ncbi:hypothetical protein FNW02_24555 [Komarekiella sp. 'clone 1']|uniref:Uncharacterized protein n=1 Tax=Komarekiella delphini-convector SJRDD-AB1 TaxID=2593771 RepID=A0AA40T1I9_9NOST|nr:hypothetical protein [Komarekiella delphini-convector SJRDD-AB1]
MLPKHAGFLRQGVQKRIAPLHFPNTALKVQLYSFDFLTSDEQNWELGTGELGAPSGDKGQWGLGTGSEFF